MVDGGQLVGIVTSRDMRFEKKLDDPVRHIMTKKDRLVTVKEGASDDEVLGLLAKSVEPFPVQPLYTEQSPGAAMTSWLVDEEQLANFTVDQDTELRSTGDSGAAVRYVKQSADIDEVRKHVEAGKQCTRLAMTWADRISFVLTDALDIKRVAPLDILTEKQDVTAVNDDEIFDADMTLMTSELSRMLTDIVESLGGERRS